MFVTFNKQTIPPKVGDKGGLKIDIFDIYFATLAGWTLHPGYNRENTEKLTLIDCAIMAGQMIEVKKAWQQSQQQQSPEALKYSAALSEILDKGRRTQPTKE